MGQCRHLKNYKSLWWSIFNFFRTIFIWVSKDAPQTTEYCPFVLFLHFENSFLESQKKHVSLEDSGKFLLRSPCCAFISNQFFHLNILSSVFQDGFFGTHIGLI